MTIWNPHQDGSVEILLYDRKGDDLDIKITPLVKCRLQGNFYSRKVAKSVFDLNPHFIAIYYE